MATKVYHQLSLRFFSRRSLPSQLCGRRRPAMPGATAHPRVPGRVSRWLGAAAAAYVCLDYLRHVRPAWHELAQPVLWAALAAAVAARAPFYRHWGRELRAAPAFVGALALMLAAFLCEMLSVRFVTAVLGVDWHSSAPPLPDVGQWLLLALNEKLPPAIVRLLRARIIGLHHFLMLFMMLAFSVVFNSVKAPGLGLAARYMFTMAIGRLLRAITFVSTILPSLRPWCASAKFELPPHPHPWAQKYYMPYAYDSDAIHNLIRTDAIHVGLQDYPGEYRPDWEHMSFLVDILRPTTGDTTWYELLKKAEGGCNDLLYSGHMLVATLTAMAWTEAYGGWTSAAIWLLVLHSAQREVREHHHYTVDCVVAIYVGILLWRMTGFIWSVKDTARSRRLAKLDEVQSRLVHAAKDSDVEEIRNLMKQVELAGQERQASEWITWVFATGTIIFTLSCVILAFLLTSDG